MNRDYYESITKLDDTNFKKLKINSYVNISKNADILQRNLWGMFKNKKKQISEGKDLFGECVSDYLWTKELKHEFENHEYHKKFINYLKKKGRGSDYEMLKLLLYPDTIDEL